jgi:hypothetical protein
MPYNICLVQPENYIHSAAFFEIAEVIGYGLQDLGHLTAVNRNQIDPDAVNILIGCHLLDPASAAKLPASTIILNTEQIDGRDAGWQRTIRQWCELFETWDYSHRNIERLAAMTTRKPRFLQLGYHPKLTRIPRAPVQDIDVLFYGTINERRRALLVALGHEGLQVETLYGVYGAQRDAAIARSKLVLNVHAYDAQIFEIVRAFYLMSNAKAVVCEVGPETSIDDCYRPGIAAAPYDSIVDCCRALLADAAARAALEARALETIKALPQSQIMAKLVA